MNSPRFCLTLLLVASFSLQAADTPSTSPATPPANAPAPSGRKGGGRGGPLTDEDRVAIAKLADLPLWKPGAGVGDFSLAPPYTAAAENAPRENVPKGRVETFQLPLAGSKFFPPAAGRDGKVEPTATREVVV